MDARYLADDAAGATAMLEGYAVLYHARSGATHLLASPVPEILEAIAPGRGAATVAEIVARLRADYELDDDAAQGETGADIGAVVAARLAELVAAGLVRAG